MKKQLTFIQETIIRANAMQWDTHDLMQLMMQRTILNRAFSESRDYDELTALQAAQAHINKQVNLRIDNMTAKG